MGFEIGKVTRLRLGYVGEDVARKIEIDVSSWLDKWPDALIHMTVKRPNEDDLYIPATDIKDGMLVWEILQSDVAIGGVGLAQIRALDRASGACYMSRVVETTIDNSMDGATDENAPDKSAGWVNQVLEAAAAVEDREEELTALVGEAKDSIATANSAAANADASADEATAAAGEAHDAADRADAAEKAAVEATEAAGKATTGANDATTAANEAAKNATDAASAAVASANKADDATDAANNAAAGATDAAKTAQTAAAAANAGAAAATEAKNAANRAASTAENAGIAAQNAAQRAEDAAVKAESISGLPENSVASQMLVSDGVGGAYWASRLAYDYGATEILPETTLAYNSGAHGYLFFTDALSDVVVGKAYMVTIDSKHKYVGIARRGVYGGTPCIGFGNPYIFPLVPGDAPLQEPWYDQTLWFAVIFPPAPSADGTANGVFFTVPGAPTESITVSIHLCDQKKLDARFLPDDIGGGLPTGGEPYKQLVTDGEGKTVWEDRLAYSGGSVEILPETALQGADDDGDGVNDMFVLTQPVNDPLVTGEMYTVIYNGAAYDCVATEMNGEHGLGNIGLITGTGDTGEPFVFSTVNDADSNEAGVYGMAMPLDGAASVTLSITKEAVRTIDEKWLPASAREKLKVYAPDDTYTENGFISPHAYKDAECTDMYTYNELKAAGLQGFTLFIKHYPSGVYMECAPMSIVADDTTRSFAIGLTIFTEYMHGIKTVFQILQCSDSSLNLD